MKSLVVSLLAIAWCGTVPAVEPAKREEPRFVFLTHASRQIFVNGEPRKQILKRWGQPNRILTKGFEALKYGRPKKLPVFDEQWIYVMPKSLTSRVVYFKTGQVSLCVEEWSDF